MKGRKKNRAEKYDAGEPLSDLSAKTRLGRFWDFKAAWMVEDICSGSKNKKDEAIVALMSYIENYVLVSRQWEHFRTLADLFIHIEGQGKKGEKVSDPEREHLLTINGVSHIVSAAIGKKKITKADLLRAYRKTASHEANLIEDEDIYRMMRQLGLPRLPEKEVMGSQAVSGMTKKILKGDLKKLLTHLGWKKAGN